MPKKAGLFLLSCSLLTAPACASLKFMTNSEFINSIADESSGKSDWKTFEYLANNVVAGSYHFSVNKIKKINKPIGIVSSIENSDNYFKLEQEILPVTVVSAIPEPRFIAMMSIGLLILTTAVKRGDKLKNMAIFN